MAPSSDGPPGGRVFSLEGRRAPGLYLVAWVLSVGGVVLLFLAPRASSDVARVGLIAVGAVSLMLGLAAAAGSQIVERRDRHPDRYRGPAPLLVFGVVLAASSILSGLLLSSGLVDSETPFGFLLGLLLVAAGYALAVWLFAVRSDGLSWAEMGWPARAVTSIRDVLRSVGVAVAVMLPVALGVLLLGGVLASILDVEAPNVLPTPTTSLEAVAVALAVAVVAPIGEELFFRGFALSAWMKDLGARAAIGRSALFFALVHIVNITSVSFGEGAAQALLQTAAILPLGLVLGWLFVRHGMVGAIAGHITYNSFLLLLLLLSTFLPEPA
ncbi:MAG: lysostaphin resistance A-like protein [Chloroflexota bacterium]